MKKCKMLLIILAALILAGCNGSKIVDERGETESVTAAEKTTTDKDPDAAVEAEFYDDARGGISVECMEMVDGELKYGIVDSEMGISVTDGEVKLRVKISGEYSFEGQLLNNENTYNLYLYHNGNLHKFNYEDSDTYMYTKKVKNGEDLNMEISFKTADEITSYKIFCIVYNDKDMLGENAEHNREYNLNSQGLYIYCQDFVLDLSENTQLDNEKEGFEVIEAEDGAAAILKVQSEKPDILLLDIMMPVLDGIEVCKQVRKMSDLPIIMVTAKDDDDDRIAGLEIGADDYITKPFNSREVVARVKAVLRRAGTQEKKGEVSRITYPGLIIDMDQYQVTAFGNKMTFTTKEMELLWCLASNPGKAFSRNQLLETIWGYSYYGDTRTVDTHIKRIRQKLNIPPDSKWDITTIWGVGYKFELKDE